MEIPEPAGSSSAGKELKFTESWLHVLVPKESAGFGVEVATSLWLSPVIPKLGINSFNAVLASRHSLFMMSDV